MSNLISETKFIIVASMILFIIILDAMMVMPLGPDFAKSLAIDINKIGYVAASYSFAAAVSGLLMALFLDYFERKKALLCTFFGLSITTLAGAFTWSENSLMAMRLASGACAGISNSLLLAMLADVIPAERRGRALGKVMSSFALASALGVPFGLELAHLFNWRLPFITTFIMASIIFVAAIYYLPAHSNVAVRVNIRNRLQHLLLNLKKPAALSAWGYTLCAMFVGFLIIPNIAGFLQFNRQFPREYLGLLYLCGGICSFVSMRLVGQLVDQYGAFIVNLVSTVLLITALLLVFIYYDNYVPVVVPFVAFMIAMSARNVSGQTLASKVPTAQERAGFMSINTAMSHMGSTIGAFFSSIVLGQDENMRIVGMENVAWFAMIVAILVPILVWNTERLLKKRRPLKVECVYDVAF